MNCRIRNAVLMLIFTAISLWFWGVLSPSILYFRESVLWFPMTWDRLLDAFCHPGGIADYVSEFIEQFFRFRAVAAFFVTAVLLAIRTLVLKISGKLGGGDLAVALSFIPAFIVWAFLCIFEYRFTAAVSLTLALSILLLLLALMEGKSAKCLTFSTLATSVAGWYICGPVAVIIPAVLLMSWKKEYLNAVYSLLTVILLPFLASLFVDYPESQLYLGTDYHIVPGQAPVLLYVAMLSVLLCTALSALPFRFSPGRKWLGIVSAAILDIAVFAGGWVYMISKCNPVNERIFRYDRLVEEEDWDEILSVGLNRRPRTYAELCAVNLALAEKGRLLEDMFVFQGQTLEALFPDYNLGYLMSLSTDRALMEAGLLNAARHYAFEKFQSFPGYRIGSRYMRSLAEIDIARGDPGPAGKYLSALSETLFYRGWAADRRKEIVAEPAEYADTCLYNDSSVPDKTLMLRRLCSSGKAGAVAGQYLVAMDLLAMDLAALRSDLEISGIGKDAPATVRQALVMAGELFGDLTDKENAMLTDADRELYAEFQSRASDAASLRSRFGNTYWYYCLGAYNSKNNLSFASAKQPYLEADRPT
ncbi:MAG: DUF6057 family protein, partial [Candidatus Cryptobacteroides sp.]